jgi:hypothetical protein
MTKLNDLARPKKVACRKPTGTKTEAIYHDVDTYRIVRRGTNQDIDVLRVPRSSMKTQSPATNDRLFNTLRV